MSLKQDAIVTERTLFADSQFHELRTIFSTMTGNKFEASKRSLFENRLRKCVLDLGIDPAEYVQLVKTQSEHRERFVTALTTHKTDWFRELPHFDFLRKKISETKSSRTEDCLVWSAACSSGEEVYSLLMTFLENGESRVRILGTDISEKCVQSGESGIYHPQQIHSQVSADLIKKYFMVGAVNGEKRYRFDPEHTRHLKWRCFNLINSDLPPTVQFDFILLRNVLIYFEPDDATEVIRRLLRYLKPGGHFIVGLSETVNAADSMGLKRVENSVYRKS
jgi:chemotaxis protein methyltransferase CheR